MSTDVKMGFPWRACFTRVILKRGVRHGVWNRRGNFRLCFRDHGLLRRREDRPSHHAGPRGTVGKVPSVRPPGVQLGHPFCRQDVSDQRHRGDGQRRTSGNHHQRQTERQRRRSSVLQGQIRRAECQELNTMFSTTNTRSSTWLEQRCATSTAP